MRRCARCPSLIDEGSYCRRCAQAKVARYNDPAYRRARAMIMATRPWCPCGKQATTVDHVIPISRGGSNHLDNLRPLCASCNRRNR